MLKTEISLVIPVYRLQAYLAQCLDSLLSQDISVFYNIVLVETGSDDGSDLICKEYQEKYPSRIYWYHYPKREPISVARNLGLLHANGKYVSFIDGDDMVSPDFLATLYKPFMDHPNLSMATASYQYLFSDGRKTKGKSHSSFHGSGVKALKRMYGFPFSFMEHYCWNRLYNRKFLLNNHLLFDSSAKIYEDLIFISEVLSEAGEVCFLKKNIYLYRQHDSSTMALAEDLLSCRLKAYQKVKERLYRRNPRLAHELFSSLKGPVLSRLNEDARKTSLVTGQKKEKLYAEATKKAKAIFGDK